MGVEKGLCLRTRATECGIVRWSQQAKQGRTQTSLITSWDTSRTIDTTRWRDHEKDRQGQDNHQSHIAYFIGQLRYGSSKRQTLWINDSTYGKGGQEGQVDQNIH